MHDDRSPPCFRPVCTRKQQIWVRYRGGGTSRHKGPSSRTFLPCTTSARVPFKAVTIKKGGENRLHSRSSVFYPPSPQQKVDPPPPFLATRMGHRPKIDPFSTPPESPKITKIHEKSRRWWQNSRKFTKIRPPDPQNPDFGHSVVNPQYRIREGHYSPAQLTHHDAHPTQTHPWTLSVCCDLNP